MKRLLNRIATHAALITLAVLVLGGCTKEPLGDNSEPTPAGDPVEVTLSLRPEVMESPVQPAAVATKAADTADTATQTADTARGGMLIELVDQPQTRAADDATVSNIWVLQFDGSADNAPLVGKTYREKVAANPRLTLKAGANQRVVVLANSFDKGLGDALTTASTYASLKELAHSSNATITGTGDVPMSGNVVGNITASTQLTVPLVRTFAKVELRVKLGPGMETETAPWKVVVHNVAPAYWLSEATGDFPAADKLTRSTLTIYNGAGFSTSTYTSIPLYLPTNRRGEVAGTHAVDRRTNAPLGATYVHLSRRSTSNNTLKRANYYIHLGANQREDYNLRGNTHYSINATLLTATAEDSRAEYATTDITELQYVGMLGGKLEQHDGVWQFTKELWAQTSNSSNGASWGDPNTNTGIVDKIDGKSNTLAMVKMPGNNYTAAWSCFRQNTNVNPTTTTVNDSSYEFFLPAQAQLTAIWTSYKSLGTPFEKVDYWSSTESTNTLGWYSNFGGGHIHDVAKNNSLKVRCVKEV